MAQTTLFSENFNGSSSLPSGWTQVSVSGTDVWQINNGGYFDNGANHPAAAHSGTRNAFLFSQGGTTRKLVTPPINLTGMGNLQLKFYEAQGKWGNDQDKLKVYYKTSASTTSWNQIAYYTTNTANWTIRTVTLPNPSATYYIAFEGIASYGYGVCIDDITITGYIAYDAGVTGFDVRNHNYLYTNIKNYGVNNLTSADIVWEIDSFSQKTFAWTGNLAQGNTATVRIDTINLSHGLHQLKFWTDSPNGKGDGDHTNDTLETDYYLINSFPYSESFETTGHHWLQSATDNFDWIRQSNSTPTYGTGPSSAYNGQYYFYASSLGNVNKSGVFVSPDINFSQLQNPYVEFWYHMYSDPQTNQPMGALVLLADTGFSVIDSFWYLSGNQGNQWHQKLVDLSSINNLSSLSFRATPASFWSDMAIDNVRIFDMPHVNLGTDTSVCQGDSITFIAPSGNNFTYQWRIGNDTVSTSASITIDSTATIICTVSGAFGYQATDTVQLTASPLPIVSFMPDDTSVCGNYPVQFTNNSTISSGSLAYHWNFGDSVSSSLDSPDHSYSSQGIFTIKLRGISNSGCSDSAEAIVYVNPFPSASFSVNDTGQCLSNNNFSFISQSSISSGSIVNLIWNSGDGLVDTASSMLHSYNQADTFHLLLIAESDSGCYDTSVRQVIVFAQPIAAFSVNDSQQCLRNNSFIFTNSSQAQGSTFSSLWDFGDLDTTSDVSPTHSFSQYNSFSVKLAITSSLGCSDSITHNTTVFPDPVAKFTIQDSLQCLKTNLFRFANLSSVATGSMQSQLWSFGDGDSSLKTSPTHNFTAEGTYNIELLTTTSDLCLDTFRSEVQLFPDPVAGFSIDSFDACFNSHYFALKNNSLITTGKLAYLWEYGVGDTSSTANPLIHFPATGNHNVSLVVTSGQNCTDTFNKFMEVFPSPKAEFNVNIISDCLSDNLFDFINTSSIDSGTLSYHWSFGDLASTSLPNPDHHYPESGSYSVQLITISDHNCNDSFNQLVHISKPPFASFTVSDTAQCLKTNLFRFTNLSSTDTGALTSLWDFGNGESSDSSMPSYTYLKAGKYRVKLKVFSDSACSDSATANVEVFANPEPNLGNDTTLHIHDTLVLNAGGGFTSYLWSTGDKDSVLKVITDNLQAGNNTIFVEVTNSQGCTGNDSLLIFYDTTNSISNAAFKDFLLYPNPARDFIILKNVPVRSGTHIIITNTSGQIVLRNEIINSEREIKLSTDQLSKGSYFLWLQFEDEIYVKTFIKM